MKKYRAPAKINLYLEVLGKREDGFHELLMLMEEVPLYDFIYIEKDCGISVDCDIIRDDDNIVFKAAQLYFDYFKLKGGVRIRLEKNIPLCAGLGGGSSDAATTLVALKDLYGSGSDEELHYLATELGSDVPFFLEEGPCIARGRGEILEKVEGSSLGWIVLVKPEFGLSAGQVYKNLDLKEKRTGDFEAFLQAYRSSDNFMDLTINSLEAPAFKLAPELEEIKKLLGENSLMSGSGTTFFKLCESQEEAKELVKGLPENLWVEILKG